MMPNKEVPPHISTLIENAKLHRASTDQLVLLGSVQDPVPRLLIIDRDLPHLAVRIWAYFRSRINPDQEASKCPVFNETMTDLGVASKETLSDSVALLRATRWLSVIERLKDGRNYNRGQIYGLHTEPISIADAMVLDEEYIEVLNKLATHRINRNYASIGKQLLNSAELHFEDQSQSALPKLEQQLEANLALSNPSSGNMFFQRRVQKSTGLSEATPKLNENFASKITGLSEATPKLNENFASKITGLSEATPKLNENFASKITGLSEATPKGRYEFRTDVPLIHNKAPSSEFQPTGLSEATPNSGGRYEIRTDPTKNRTAQSSSSYLNKKTTTTNTDLSHCENVDHSDTGLSEATPNSDKISELIFHQNLNLNQNQQQLGILALERVDPKYRQLIIDEVAARTKIASIDPDNHGSVRSPVAYIQWHCQQISQGKMMLTGRHPDSVEDPEQKKKHLRKQSEEQHKALEQQLEQAHDERIKKYQASQERNKAQNE